jgi:hypothetical protein
MTAGWRWDPDRLRAELAARGYDVDGEAASLTADGGSLHGRRDRGERSEIVVIDAGGRFRGVVTVVDGETSGTTGVAGVPLRVVEEGRRVVTITGMLSENGQLGPVLAALDELGGGRRGAE